MGPMCCSRPCCASTRGKGGAAWFETGFARLAMTKGLGESSNLQRKLIIPNARHPEAPRRGVSKDAGPPQAAVTDRRAASDRAWAMPVIRPSGVTGLAIRPSNSDCSEKRTRPAA